MIAENNLESHGTWEAYNKGYVDLDFVVPKDKPQWREMMLDRANSCYQRDKNHPAILIWSCGNESFGGKTIYEMSQLFRQLDKHRLVHYEGVFSDRSYNDTSDMESQMYTPAAGIEKFLAEHPEKPFICCEYTHAMGNSCGAMHKYTELTDREPRYQGGFIWDYIDQSIYKRTDTASGSSHMAEISATGLQMEISAETASATAERERLLQRCRRLSSIIRISRLILTATTSLQSQTKIFL